MSSRSEEILKKVRKIEISTRKIVETILSGQYHTRYKGQGMQFSEFREYYAGDDIRHIDWKVTARTQLAHIRKFEEERDLTVYLLVDLSQSGVFGSGEKTKQEALVEVCALIAFAAVKNNDRVGLVLFTDQVERHIPPKKGRAHAMRILSEIFNFKPASTKTSLKTALEFYANVVRHSAVVFVASDFLDKGYDKTLKRVARKHDLLAVRMQDPRDSEVPPIGKIELEDAETGEVFWVDTAKYSFQSEFKKKRTAFEKELSQLFLQAGVERIDLSTREDYFRKIVTFFRSRKRRRR